MIAVTVIIFGRTRSTAPARIAACRSASVGRPARCAQASRQAHADLPEGTYEREISKDGFFGPAAFLYHRRPPTGWTGFEGPLRPRAFNLAALNEADPSPWAAPAVLLIGGGALVLGRIRRRKKQGQG